MRGLVLLVVTIGLPLLCIIHCEVLDRQHPAHSAGSAPPPQQHAHGHEHHQTVSVISDDIQQGLAGDRPHALTTIQVGTVCHPHHHTAPPAVYPAVVDAMTDPAAPQLRQRHAVRAMPAWTSLAPRSPDPPPRTTSSIHA